MSGTFYCVGIGPGDPKLMTYLAVETIQKCEVIALPNSGAKENAAQSIAERWIREKPVLYCDMPMSRDKEKLRQAHETAAEKIAEHLKQGENVAFLTLGDPSIYSTAMYLHRCLKERGYQTKIIPGVPSFCAAAAVLDISLCERNEMLHIIPASYPDVSSALSYSGTKVLMKSGKAIAEIKTKVDKLRADAMAVECCGMENEKIYPSLDALRENASYFTIVLVKEKKDD